MNRWVQRGLRTALLTGGFLAVGAGVAAADENDLTVDLLGVTTTVPVADDAVVQAPVLTGHGGNTTVGSDPDGGFALPVDTATVPGTTALGSDGVGGVSVPVRVTEAADDPPAPEDGFTLTVPVNTSGGGAAGTTLTVPIVTGSLGGVLDGDPLTGNDIGVDLDGPLVLGTDGSGVLLDLEDTVTIRKTDGETAPRTVLEVPAGLEDDRPTTVTLPLGDGDATSGPVSGNDVDVHLGGLIGNGEPPAADEPATGEPGLSVPVGTGELLSGAIGGDALTGNTVDVHLGDLLGADGSGTGTVVAVPVNEGGSGTGSDNLVRITIPIDLTGDGDGPGDGAGPGAGEGSAGDGAGDGEPVGSEGADCTASSQSPVSTEATGSESGSGTGTVELPGASATSVDDGGDPCGVGEAGALTTRSSSTGQFPAAISAMAGMSALALGLLVALGRRRLRDDRS